MARICTGGCPVNKDRPAGRSAKDENRRQKQLDGKRKMDRGKDRDTREKRWVKGRRRIPAIYTIAGGTRSCASVRHMSEWKGREVHAGAFIAPAPTCAERDASSAG